MPSDKTGKLQELAPNTLSGELKYALDYGVYLVSNILKMHAREPEDPSLPPLGGSANTAMSNDETSSLHSNIVPTPSETSSDVLSNLPSRSQAVTRSLWWSPWLFVEWPCVYLEVSTMLRALGTFSIINAAADFACPKTDTMSRTGTDQGRSDMSQVSTAPRDRI
jgi:hypothetical protein